MKAQAQPIRYPRARMDALCDGIFAVAMTLLVLDVRLPDEFHPANAAELLHAMWELTAKLGPYVLSFVVLGFRWLSTIQVRTHTESYDSRYIQWWIFYLLLITCVPFTTTMVGRYISLAPAIWLYSGVNVLIALVSLRLLALTPELEHEHHLRNRQVSLILLLVSSLLCIAWSFVEPSQALWAMLLNLAGPYLRPRQKAAD